MAEFSTERSVLEGCVREAGALICRIAADGFETAHKKNSDPVTTADLAADGLLRAALPGVMPGSGWLSEETKDHPERLDRRFVWVVDPVDGTKEFVKGIPEFAVSVALVEDGRAVLAAVYNPATDEIFSAVLGGGATLNGRRIRSQRHFRSRPVILASRSEVARGEFACFDRQAEVRQVGSIAYKLALVAAGRADATFSLGPKHEWDIAAGVLLVQEAGGTATDVSGGSFRFNQARPLVPSILAGTSSGYWPVKWLIERCREPQL